jgi:2-amino-4-hydroxy-6-hydroxymethyldihydropteridine diphosphokinase
MRPPGARTGSAGLALVALGSNLGDSCALIHRAMPELERLSGQPMLKSSLWRSDPVDCPPGSAPFINAAVALHPAPDETPESLLGTLQDLERRFGRQPKKLQNEARPLDLDLIAFGSITCSTAALVLPHPRAHLRRFVLEPLAEIVPDFLLPGQRRTIQELLEELGSAENVTRLDA